MRVRRSVAAILAVGTLSLGATACAPPGRPPPTVEEIGSFLSTLLGFYLWTHQPCGNCSSPTTSTTAPPATIPEPVGA